MTFLVSQTCLRVVLSLSGKNFLHATMYGKEQRREYRAQGPGFGLCDGNCWCAGDC